MRLLCLGTGYVALHLARRLGSGSEIIGTARSPQKAEILRAAGITPVAPEEAPYGRASHILVSAAPGQGGDPFVQAARASGVRPDWLGYLSATSVYGDHDGDWVDETTPLTPSGPRGVARVAAEEAWAASGLPLHIFRLAGVYGPGRSAFDRLRAGDARRIVKPGQFFSRIHVDDIVSALLASMARPEPGLVVNLADDDPAPPQEVVSCAAALLGVTPPAEEDFASAEMSAMARSFYDDNKRVRNQRLKTLLPVLSCPDYRAGLRAILAAERG